MFRQRLIVASCWALLDSRLRLCLRQTSIRRHVTNRPQSSPCSECASSEKSWNLDVLYKIEQEKERWLNWAFRKPPPYVWYVFPTFRSCCFFEVFFESQNPADNTADFSTCHVLREFDLQLKKYKTLFFILCRFSSVLFLVYIYLRCLWTIQCLPSITRLQPRWACSYQTAAKFGRCKKPCSSYFCVSEHCKYFPTKSYCSRNLLGNIKQMKHFMPKPAIYWTR